VIDWLLSPLSGSSGHLISESVAWHARLMVLAWGVIIPVAILLARYWKIWPGQRWPEELDHRAWWYGHKYGQTLAIALVSLGAYIAWKSSAIASSQMLKIHAILGWFLLLVGWMQILGAWLRGTKGGPTESYERGDHFDMTLKRRVFERIHKLLGWLALALAMVTMILGFIIADAPRWMMVCLTLWWLVLLALAWHWQRQSKCIDTYQAIWGSDPSLPGMKMAPIGLGVHRVKPILVQQKETAHETSQLY
jgi:Eukaryotic cytochrome b561